MERIRILAGGLLLLTGVVHVLQLFTGPMSMGAAITVLFGVLYLIIGVLILARPTHIWFIMGIIVPLLGLFLTVLGILTANAFTMLHLFFIVMDVVVVVCCIYLATGKK
jgi:hypothetical protein